MSAVAIERFNARISREEKLRLERAAELSGSSLTDFVMRSAQAAAVQTIERYESVKLVNPRDRDAFANALINPPEPSDRLRAAARRYLTTVAR